MHRITQQLWRNTTLFTHWYNVEMTWRRCINIVWTLKLYHVSA